MMSTTLTLILLLQISLLTSSDVFDEIKQPSIGVVGAGLSGLFSAIRLSELGYKNITIYEKANRVGGAINTFILSDGRPYDLHTMWVPDSSVYGFGVPPFLRHILNTFNVTLDVADRQGTVITPDGNTPEINLPFVDLHVGVQLLLFSLSRNEIVSMHLDGFHLLKKYRSCYDKAISCAECGICASPSELPEQYGERTNTSHLMMSLSTLAFTLGTGPTSPREPYRTADFVFRVNSIWYPSVIAQTFKNLDVTIGELKLLNPEPELIEILESNNSSGPVGYYYFKDGFQAFADTIASMFTVKLNTQILSVHRELSWIIKTNHNEIFEHDILLLANPPRTQPEKEMFPVGPIKSAMDLIDVTQPSTEVVLFDTGNATWDPQKIPGNATFNRYFLKNTPIPIFGFVLKRYDDVNVIEVASSGSHGLTDEQLSFIAAERLNGLLLKDGEKEDFTKLTQSSTMFPPIPLPKDEITWETYMTKISNLRDEGLYVVGEHVCGTGAAELAFCINQLFLPLEGKKVENSTPPADETSGNGFARQSALCGILLVSLIVFLTCKTEMVSKY